MSATCKWLDIAKAMQQIETDYRLAKVLGIESARIYQYRSSRQIVMGDEIAIKVAELAEVSPGVVLAELAAERSKTPEARAVWLSVAKVAKQAA